MNRIEEQARYYRNIPLRDRNIRAVVHLEDAEDILFWSNQLQEPSLQITTLLHTRRTKKVMTYTVVNNVYATKLILQKTFSFA